MHEKIETLNIKRTSKSGQFDLTIYEKNQNGERQSKTIRLQDKFGHFDLAVYEKNRNIKGTGKVRQFDSIIKLIQTSHSNNNLSSN